MTVQSRVRRRRRIKLALKVLGFALLVTVVVIPIVSADVRFLARATYEEARTLLKRRSLDRLIADSARPAEQRAAFALVRDARRFGADSLGLAAKQTFATYAEVGHDTLVLVVSASPHAELTEYLWHFPIVGAVPYKGFFDIAGAADEIRSLEARGFDTYVRPAAAFSTLGWFDDPLLSTAVTKDRVALAGTVLHELTHNTWYVPSATPFDESLAEFVGWKGAERFFQARGDTASAQRAAATWRDERRLGVFYQRLSGRLQTLYAPGLVGAAMDSGRALIFREARAQLASGLDGTLEVYRGKWLGEMPINNATVIAQRIYRTRLDLFDQILDAYAGDLPAALKAIGRVVKTDAGRRDPYQAVYALWMDSASGRAR